MDWKIGILCAGDEEFAPFEGEIQNPVVTEKAMLRFLEGSFGGLSVVALYSGVCRVNAAVAAQILIDTFHVDAVINAGTAGGMDPALRLFDTVVCTQAAYHDVDEEILTDFHPWLASPFFDASPVLLKAAGEAAVGREDIRFGRIVTGESFIEDDGRKAILEQYSPLCVDMETAGIAHVCHVNGIPFLAVRTITDTAEHSGVDTFEENCARASAIAKDAVRALLQKLRGMEDGRDL